MLRCNNCGSDVEVRVQVVRWGEEDPFFTRGDQRGSENIGHPEQWCLNCIQGNNPVRKGIEIPREWF